MVAKKELVEYYLRNYDIKATQRDMESLSEKQLLIKLETKWQVKKEELAAIKLQALGRMAIWRAWLLRTISTRHASASRVQR